MWFSCSFRGVCWNWSLCDALLYNMGQGLSALRSRPAFAIVDRFLCSVTD